MIILKAVHFGAGSIGRGFIGDLLFESGYEITFVDIDEKIIKQINRTNSYDLFIIEDDYHKKSIYNVQAVSSFEEDTVTTKIMEADIITTSVWADNLSKIAPSILKGLRVRQQEGKPKINIITCENALGNSDLLKKYILDCNIISQEELADLAAFPNTAVDRLVLENIKDETAVINIGKDYELVIEKNKLVNTHNLPLKNAIYTDDLQKYVEKKLFIINGGHAWAGYIGHLHGYKIIQDVFYNDELVHEVREVMLECANLLVKKHSFSKKELEDYIAFAIGRFKTPGIKDTISRVSRSPIRKLSPTDRLVGPAMECEKFHIKNDYLIKGIAAAFLFENSKDDQANELNTYIKNNGIDNAITKYTRIPVDSALFGRILDNYFEMKKIKNEIRS